MTIKLLEVSKYAGAALTIGAVIAAPIKFFETKAAAEEKSAKQEKTVIELKLDLLTDRIQALNEKPKLTKQEQQELDIKLAMVAEIRKDQVKPKDSK